MSIWEALATAAARLSIGGPIGTLLGSVGSRVAGEAQSDVLLVPAPDRGRNPGPDAA